MNLKGFLQVKVVLKEVFSSKAYLLGFSILAIAVLGLYAVLTNIYSLQLQSFNPIAEPLQIALVSIIAVLTAIVLALTIYKIRIESVAAFSGKSFVGSFAGFFASACPVCQPIWLYWLGLGTSTVFLADYSLLLAVLSIGILSYSLYSICNSFKTCELKGLKGRVER